MKMKRKNYWAYCDNNFTKVTVGWYKNQDDPDQPVPRKVSEITFTKKQWLVLKGIVDNMFQGDNS